jgi:hypothetical protein
MTHDTPEPAKSAAPNLDRIVDDFAAIKRDLIELMDHVRTGAADNAAGAIGRQVEERPMISLLIAFSVGVIASRFLPR